MLFRHVHAVALQAREMVILHFRLGRFVIDVWRGGGQRLGFGVDSRRAVGTEASGRHEASSDGKYVDGLVWRVAAGRQGRIFVIIIRRWRGRRRCRKRMEERVDERFLHFLEIIDVPESGMSNDDAYMGDEKKRDIPFLAGNDLPQNFLSCPLTRTKITHQIILCTLAPRGGGEDPRAGVGHLRIRSPRADGTRIG